MKNYISLSFFFLIGFIGVAQEINFQLTINSDLVNQTNQQIFKNSRTKH